MKIWIYLNGVQQGPYTFDELRMLPMEPTTPVWYDGLSEWTPAGQAPATMPLFTAPAPPPQPQPVQPAWQPQQPAWQPQQIPPRPSTYLVWSILITLLCCTPLSIAAIVTGAITNSRYNSGDYNGARSMSSVTEWLVILSIVFGVLALPLTLIMLL